MSFVDVPSGCPCTVVSDGQPAGLVAGTQYETLYAVRRKREWAAYRNPRGILSDLVIAAPLNAILAQQAYNSDFGRLNLLREYVKTHRFQNPVFQIRSSWLHFWVCSAFAFLKNQ